jgi:prepilin-type N-terminal cleavage/methylation domain-containing protein
LQPLTYPDAGISWRARDLPRCFIEILKKMKTLQLNSKVVKTMRGRSRGFSMLEVVIAIGLLGIIAVAVLSALSAASLALVINDRRATAESLARTEMEFIRNQLYIDYSVSGHEVYDQVEGYGENYDVDPTVEPIDPANYEPYPFDEGEGAFQQDDGIQLITVTVTYYILGAGNKEVERQFIIEDFKRKS